MFESQFGLIKADVLADKTTHISHHFPSAPGFRDIFMVIKINVTRGEGTPKSKCFAAKGKFRSNLAGAYMCDIATLSKCARDPTV